VSGRRDGLIVVGMLVALVIGISLVYRQPQPVGPPWRIDGHGAYGLSGLHAGLEEAGIQTRRGLVPTIPAHGLTISVEPDQISRDEAASWLQSVRSGGTLLLATARPNAVTRALGLHFVGGGYASATAQGQYAFPDAQPPVGSVRSLTHLPEGSESLFTSDRGSLMVVVSLGEGSVWVMSDPRWLANSHVVETGLPIALPLAEVSGGETVFDEYHHGAAGRLGPFSFLPYSAQILLLQGALLALLAAVTAARRLGPLRPQREPATRSTVELARSLAQMHRGSRRIEAATQPLAHGFRRALGSAAEEAAGPLAALEGARDEGAAVKACNDVEHVMERRRSGDR